MDRKLPRTGEIYRHFKDKLYQIVTVAEHSETGESLVVYQALYGAYKVYARPLAMFLSEVDRAKYPKASQKYRFEQVETEKKPPQEAPACPPVEEAAQPDASPAEENGAGADSRLLEFLDADTFLEKYQVIKSMENEITDRLINDFAVVLDVVIPEGSLQQRYTQLKQCVATMCRYETTRLR